MIKIMEGRGNTTSGIGCHICGLVLARGGSKRVPRKNVRSIAGLPLLAWVLHPMLDCKKLTSVWVSTDDTEIAEVALRYGAQVHYRDKKTAKDSSTSLAGVQDFLHKHPEISIIALVQCTSPCLLPMYLDKACEMMLEQNYDSVFSVVRQKKLRWKEVKAGKTFAVLNYRFSSKDYEYSL
ncbi:UNVERIFIED_CONTAM: N(4)-(Beta-N-acetylglucosaminyl)-L-asparaginase-acylneuraminate cytidylyltransferase [Trichonephila clavipes]